MLDGASGQRAGRSRLVLHTNLLTGLQVAENVSCLAKPYRLACWRGTPPLIFPCTTSITKPPVCRRGKRHQRHKSCQQGLQIAGGESATTHADTPNGVSCLLARRSPGPRSALEPTPDNATPVALDPRCYPMLVGREDPDRHTDAHNGASCLPAGKFLPGAQGMPTGSPDCRRGNSCQVHGGCQRGLLPAGGEIPARCTGATNGVSRLQAGKVSASTWVRPMGFPACWLVPDQACAEPSPAIFMAAREQGHEDARTNRGPIHQRIETGSSESRGWQLASQPGHAIHAASRLHRDTTCLLKRRQPLRRSEFLAAVGSSNGGPDSGPLRCEKLLASSTQRGTSPLPAAPASVCVYLKILYQSPVTP